MGLTNNNAFKNAWATTNIITGAPVYYGNGIVLDSGSSYNTLIGNTANSNLISGIIFSGNNNNLTDNTANSNIDDGIFISSSNNNAIMGNTANSNAYGIQLSSSYNNAVTGNMVNSNRYGIALDHNSDNTRPNTIANNAVDYNNIGIDVTYSNYNIFYNNHFNNTDNYNDLGSTSFNFWNIPKTLGTNIVGGPYLGGNFWANPSGTGISQICQDTDGDGICDSQHSLLDGNNTDFLSLSSKFISEAPVIPLQ